MDLEMTGLEADRHVIVEIATLITDDNLDVTAEGPDLVIHAGPGDLAAMDDFVREMHTHSGLLAAMEKSTLTLAEAGRQSALDAGIDTDELAGTPPVTKNDDAGDFSKQRVVFAAADILAGLVDRAALPHQDRTACHQFSTKSFDPQALSVGVAPVF